MTAIATIFALLPMALGLTGSGGFISQPLAVVVIGGLLSSTVLTLVLVPTLYTMVEQPAGTPPGPARRRGPVRPAPPRSPRSRLRCDLVAGRLSHRSRAATVVWQGGRMNRCWSSTRPTSSAVVPDGWWRDRVGGRPAPARRAGRGGDPRAAGGRLGRRRPDVVLVVEGAARPVAGEEEGPETVRVVAAAPGSGTTPSSTWSRAAADRRASW